MIEPIEIKQTTLSVRVAICSTKPNIVAPLQRFYDRTAVKMGTKPRKLWNGENDAVKLGDHRIVPNTPVSIHRVSNRKYSTG